MIRLRTTLAIGLFWLFAGFSPAGEDVKIPARMIEVELLIAETSRVGTAAGGELSLSLPAEKLRASLLEWEQQGQLDAVARVRLTTIENSSASVAIGQMTAVVAGRATGRGGGVSMTTMSDRNTGMMVGVAARALSDRRILAELDVAQSRLVPRPAAEGKEGELTLPPQTVSAKLSTTVSIPEGQTVVATGAGLETSGRKSLLVVLVSARILAAAPR